MNWQTLVQKECGVIASQEEIDAHMQQARDKLARIIQTEGDSCGERKKPWYLAVLLGEMIVSDRFSFFCMQASMVNEKKEREHFLCH